MKVKLAAQTLSQSVASALQFLKALQLPNFNDVDGTVMFCEKMNDIFDLLNSCHPMGKYSKAAITKTNKDLVERRVRDGLEFLGSVYLDEPPVLKTKRRTPFQGLAIDLLSVLEISKELVWSDSASLIFLLCKKFSQDHLELFFFYN